MIGDDAIMHATGIMKIPNAKIDRDPFDFLLYLSPTQFYFSFGDLPITK